MSELLRKALVEFSSVSHYGVDYDFCFGNFEIIEYFSDYIELFERAEIACVNCVKVYIFVFPVLCNGKHIVCKISESESAELSVCGKYGCRHNGSFHAHC